ncbi:killer cell lectin-like receptor subfamily B member 1A [Mauremys mutica]|uniref:killer cell lectin-like receptor subfamily B member 1A n=1 Tax=Mauremys mutica TaxID=74926 RepID=UPI001D166A0B|nr:killer cell lectin-like receptor subfamily B member 1A [Mauremys mutica]
MQDEEGDVGLDPQLHKGSLFAAGNQAADPEPPTLPVPAPCRHRHCLVALGAGCISLTLAVIVLSRVVSHLVSEKGQTPAAAGSDRAGSRDTATPPGSDGAGSRDPSTAECSARLERFRSQLCPPAPAGPAGGSGCKLCPTDWRLDGDKCYWVSRGSKTWSESRADCSARGSQLLVIRDREELESLQALTGGTSQFWVGLSVPSPEKAWTWLDGSRLDQTQFPASGPAEGNSCGVVEGNRIRSDTCDSGFQWICQRDAVPL